MIAGKSAVSELSAFGPARSTVEGSPLNDEEARQVHAFWRACNYLALGMIYLQNNPLLREPLHPDHIKNRMLGHWGASPALSFALEPRDKTRRPRHDLYGRPGTWSPRGSGPALY